MTPAFLLISRRRADQAKRRQITRQKLSIGRIAARTGKPPPCRANTSGISPTGGISQPRRAPAPGFPAAAKPAQY